MVIPVRYTLDMSIQAHNSAAGWLLRIYSTRPGATAAEKLRKSPVSLTWTGEGKVIRHLLVGINQNSVTLATENS